MLCATVALILLVGIVEVIATIIAFFVAVLRAIATIGDEMARIIAFRVAIIVEAIATDFDVIAHSVVAFFAVLRLDFAVAATHFPAIRSTLRIRLTVVARFDLAIVGASDDSICAAVAFFADAIDDPVSAIAIFGVAFATFGRAFPTTLDAHAIGIATVAIVGVAVVAHFVAFDFAIATNRLATARARSPSFWAFATRFDLFAIGATAVATHLVAVVASLAVVDFAVAANSAHLFTRFPFVTHIAGFDCLAIGATAVAIHRVAIVASLAVFDDAVATYTAVVTARCRIVATAIYGKRSNQTAYIKPILSFH